MKKILSFFISAALILSSSTITVNATTQQNNSQIKIVIDGKNFPFTEKTGQPFIENGTMYIPVNETLSFLNFQTGVNASGEKTKDDVFIRNSEFTKPYVAFVLNENNEELIWQYQKAGKSYFQKGQNEKPIKIAKIKNSIKYLKAKELFENLGYNYSYDKATKTLQVTENKKEITKKEEIDNYLKELINSETLNVANKKVTKLIIDSDIGYDIEHLQAKEEINYDIIEVSNKNIKDIAVGVVTKNKEFKLMGMVKTDEIKFYPYKFYDEKEKAEVQKNKLFNGELKDITQFMIFIENKNDENLTAIITPNPYK